MNFLYKTRGNSTPRGKTQVLVLGHSEDFVLFFEELSNEILKYQNCAIWYTDEGLIDGEQETEWTLSQMQMFVVIVTERFLQQAGDVAKRICNYADNHHVPILPIVFEVGIESLYSVYFQSRHFLSPVANSQYITDISYEQKLKKYLNDVLVGNEEIEQIRREFDAYIFLSYRKKDREYALKLMKRIHQNKYFHKVAIWYDEFLMPGVSFADKIEEKLKSSDLFVMAVTPNVLEENNYVREVEYKEAAKEGKKIFPVEIVKTNREELQQAFWNIPECVAFSSGELFDKQLYENLEERLHTEKPSTPEQDYYIGLAYLDGVDVEVDSQKALELITRAAAGGWIEAYEKLVVMYREGKGVARDFAVSLNWQKWMIQELQRKYQTKPTRYLRSKLYIALFEIIETYEREDRIEQAEAYIYQMAELVNEGAEYMDLLIYSRVLFKLGAVEAQKGNVNEAREYYIQSIKVRQQLTELAAPEEKSECIRAISAVYLCLGDLEKSIYNFPHAQEYYARAGEIRQWLVENSAQGSAQELGFRRDLAVTLDRMGSLFENLGNAGVKDTEKYIIKAYEFYTHSLEEKLKVDKEVRTEQSRDELVTAYLSLTKMELLYGTYENAKVYAQNAVTLMNTLVQKRGNLRAWKRLARSYELYARAELKASHTAEAFSAFQEAYHIMETVAEQTKDAYDAEYLAEIANILEKF